jgi:hypothetical protein
MTPFEITREVDRVAHLLSVVTQFGLTCTAKTNRSSARNNKASLGGVDSTEKILIVVIYISTASDANQSHHRGLG